MPTNDGDISALPTVQVAATTLEPGAIPLAPLDRALSLVNAELRLANEAQAALNEELTATNEELRATLDDLGEAQTQLSKAKEYAERLIDTAHVIVVGLDRDGKVEQLNLAAAELIGYSKQELLGRDWFEVAIPPEGRSELAAVYQAARDNAARLPQQYSNQVRTRSGQVREIDWQNTSFELDGKFAGCLSIGLDVTVRNLAEQSLNASETRYRRLFETAKDGILILDADSGVVADVNPYLCELLGLSHTEIKGKKVWELGFLKDVAASRENFSELQRHEYIRYEDLPLETAAGLRIDAEFVSNVYQVNGSLVVQCNIRNITARKKAENALHALHAELEQRVVDRTAELAFANEALQRETVERLRAEELQLTSVVDERTRIAREIHDTLAQGFAGIILQLEAAEDIMPENAQVANGHVVKARQLARDSLSDARRSMWALRPQMLDKGDLVYAINSVIENLAKESLTQFEFTHHGERQRLPKECEESLLRICQEALMNAGKHGHAKNVSVELLFEPEQVELRITDDGQGFDVASAPFLRGLGLRIMKERAAKLHGNAVITSHKGRGTQVVVHIPVAAVADGEAHD